MPLFWEGNPTMLSVNVSSPSSMSSSLILITHERIFPEENEISNGPE